MNIYFIYYADMYDRSVGKVLLNEEPFIEKEFKEMVKIAKERTDGYESSIIEYLIKYFNFVIADIPSCNIETI